MSDDASTKTVDKLTPEEIAAEGKRLQARKEALAKAILGPTKGKTVEEALHHIEVTSRNILTGLDNNPKHPGARRATVQIDGTQRKLIDLTREYRALEKRDKEIAARIESNESLAPAVNEAAQKADPAAEGPTFGTEDDPTAFEPVFLSDQGIEDMARTGEFDIGPSDIAAMFPSAAVQMAEADEDPATGASLLDQLQPAQYKNNQFVNIGQGFATPDTTTMQRNQITDADLPDWEKKVLLAELDQQEKPQTTRMSEEEYNAARMQIFNEGSVGPERELKLQKLAQAHSASKAATKGTGSLRDIISKPYGMTASEVSAAAVQLFKAGYLNLEGYDPEKKLSEQMHITSAFDPGFQKAWNSWVSDSFKDRSKDMMSILRERQDSFMGQLQLYADEIKAKRVKAAPTIQLTDSAGIRVGSDELGVSTIGRKLTDTEHQMLVGYIHNLETAQQSAMIGGATNVESVDVNARLLEAIRANNPVAADATEEANQYKAFTSLLAGPRGM